MTIEFTGFGSTSRLYRGCTITEKIDGTNAQIYITEDEFLVGSRNRWITSESDNFGFAKFCYANKEELIKNLGPGRHFGEWWGGGVTKAKFPGKEGKTLSLFDNPSLWECPLNIGGVRVSAPPILYSGDYKDGLVTSIMEKLISDGSVNWPGTEVEGIVLRFKTGEKFKVTVDDRSKWERI